MPLEQVIGVAGAAERRELGLEGAHLGAEDKLAMRQHPRHGVIDGAAEPAALGGDVDERDRPLVQASVLIHREVCCWRMTFSENRHPRFGIMR